MSSQEFFEVNRLHWEDRVPIHVRDATGFYRVEAFLRGEDSLLAIEAAELGDVGGKRLLHLQCHFGLDTLSLSRRGATVTGIDFSPSAIAAANGLAQRAGLSARFIEGNVYDTPTVAPGPFDIVYTTWGTIVWLPDVVRWASVIAQVLAPGGFLYFADFHPAMLLLEQVDGRLVPSYPWRTNAAAPLNFEAANTYTGDPTPLAHRKTCEWIHPVSDIVSALLDAGLVLEMLHEHEHVPARTFPMMVEAGAGFFRLPDGMSPIPLALSLRARKPDRR